jgi:hypothetical protein
MATAENEYRFHIHAFTPETIPMKRLAEYMGDLANLLGHPHSVHFVRVDAANSLSLVHRVDTEDIPKVRERLQAIARDRDNAPSDAMAAYHALNVLLENDNTSAEIFAEDNVIEFPGRIVPPPEPLIIGPIVQRDSLVGIPIMVGGKRDLVPVHLETANGPRVCHTKRTIARRLGRYLFDDVIKAVGEAKWIRTEQEGWLLEDFVIDDFDPTNDHDLDKSLEVIRKATEGNWSTNDPVGELLRLRRDEK